MQRLIKCLAVYAALVAAPAFAAPPDPHHPEAAVTEPAKPDAKADANHGCPMMHDHVKDEGAKDAPPMNCTEHMQHGGTSAHSGSDHGGSGHGPGAGHAEPQPKQP